METTAIGNDRNNRTSVIHSYEIALENINNISRLAMMNESITYYLTSDSIKNSNSKNAIRDMYYILNAFGVNYSVTIFRKDQNYINVGPGITYINKKIVFSDQWMSEIRERNGGFVLKSNTDNAFRTKTGKVISFVRVINDLNTQKEIGLLEINIPLNFFEQTYAGLSSSRSHFAFYDKSGYLINSDNPSVFKNIIISKDIKNGQKISKGLFKENIISIDKVPNTNIILITYSEVDIFEGFSQKLLGGILGVIILILYFMNQINSFLVKNVTKPIQKLIKSMSEVQNGWLHRVSMSVNDDEIGQLKNSYNAMLIEINHLIDELIKKEKNLQKAELDALQEQIKPHFLYNTIDTIRYLLLENETDKVYNMLETLGNFYRRFLSKGQRDIMLEEELGIVKDYLTLQKNRYEEVFDDEYDIQENLLKVRVPRLILQPFVENAIYHGVRLKGEKGLIKITAFKKDEMLHIKIYDTGVGMSEKQIQLLSQETNNRSFGFKGTIERIRYYYNEDDVFEVHSHEGEFFEVELKLPFKEEL
jgi:two-component system sensor histidine kinase YesM